MKKLLIALLVGAGYISAATAQVAITGVFDASYQNQKTTYGDSASATQNGIANNNMGTSQITFSGKEDLGRGTSAIFKLENDFDVSKDGKDNFGSKGGEVFVGLEGGLGQVKLGAPNYPSLAVQGARSPFGTKLGGGNGTVNGTARIRPSGNAMSYTSPNMGGLTLSALRVNSTSADVNGSVTAVDAQTDVSATFAKGPFAAGVSHFAVNGSDAKQTNYYGSVVFGPAKVTLGGHAETSATGGKSKGNNIAGAYTIGATTLMANYGKLNDETSANADKDIKAVGVAYAMSKRTTLYTRYVKETNDNVATTAGTTAVAGRTTLLAGLQHTF